MKKNKFENGSITLFVVVSFLFCMIMLVRNLWRRCEQCRINIPRYKK